MYRKFIVILFLFTVTHSFSQNSQLAYNYFRKGEYEKALSTCQSEMDYLLLADLYKKDYKLDLVLETYIKGAEKYNSLDLFVSWAEYLLALEMKDEAGGLDELLCSKLRGIKLLFRTRELGEKYIKLYHKDSSS